MSLKSITFMVIASIAYWISVAPPGTVDFQAHDIDAGFRGGYAVSVADFNKDGKLDVIANSLQVQEVAWYENPGWQRHVVVGQTPQIVNQAMADIDGDGIPEVAFESSFAMQATSSEGIVWLARHQGSGQPWKVEQLDKFPTSHHIVWADLDGDGKPELVNAPLLGPKSLAPTYDQDLASVFWYGQKDWKRHLVADNIPGIIHRVRPVQWDGNKRDQLLVASFEGIVLYRATGTGDGMKFEKQLLSAGHASEKAPRLGASDVAVGKQNSKRFFASVEPWHGNEVVVYTDSNGRWERHVIFDKVASGHEIAVADLNGDGRDDVIANDNNRTSGGVHVFYAPEDPAAGQWLYQKIEEKLAMNSCAAADLNADRRVDLICTGNGGAIRWYENRGSK